jgi:cell division protein FtsQ
MESRITQSRADTVRQRRTSRPHKSSSPLTVKRGKKNATTTRPPVLMRGALLGSYAAERPRTKKAKRRYDVALNTPGVEIRLPSLPRIALGWRLLSGLLVILLGAALYYVWSSPFFQVESLDVTGLQRLSNEALNSATNVVGQSILFVEPAQIQDDLLKAFPELSEVAVDIKIPNSVIVSVVERKPILTWKQEKKVFWVDSTGVVYPSGGEGGPAIVVKADSLPFTTTSVENPNEGEEPQEDLGDTLQLEQTSEPAVVTISQDLIQAILVLGNQKPDNTPLLYNQDHGLGWKDSKGWQVYFGDDVDQLEMKLSVYKAIVKRLKKEGTNPSMISVENVHAPYYRVER